MFTSLLEGGCNWAGVKGQSPGEGGEGKELPSPQLPQAPPHNSPRPGGGSRKLPLSATLHPPSGSCWGRAPFVLLHVLPLGKAIDTQVPGEADDTLIDGLVPTHPEQLPSLAMTIKCFTDDGYQQGPLATTFRRVPPIHLRKEKGLPAIRTHLSFLYGVELCVCPTPSPLTD